MTSDVHNEATSVLMSPPDTCREFRNQRAERAHRVLPRGGMTRGKRTSFPSGPFAACSYRGLTRPPPPRLPANRSHLRPFSRARDRAAHQCRYPATMADRLRLADLLSALSLATDLG